MVTNSKEIEKYKVTYEETRKKRESKAKSMAKRIIELRKQLKVQ